MSDTPEDTDVDSTDAPGVAVAEPGTTQGAEAEPRAEGTVIEFRPRKGGATIGPVQQHGTAARAMHEAEEPDAPLEHQLEALLFVSPTPLSTEVLADATDTDPDDLQDCLLDMMQQYSEGRSGIVLERVAGGWAFRASDRTRVQLARLLRPQADTKLSPSSMETLAIVAYLQPISRPDVARVRGVSVDAAMSGLLERGFVEEAGRGETGAVLFRTTALFERAFGLSSIGALPELDGFAPTDEDVARLREQLEQMAAARVE